MKVFTEQCLSHFDNRKYNDYASVKYLLADQLHGSLQRPDMEIFNFRNYI
jgi:hypothetical protein